MNFPLVCRHLGSVALIIGASMLFSLVWASPAFGGDWATERFGVRGLLGAVCVCAVVGLALRRWGRKTREATLFRKEAMAVVALSWILATFLGGLPYLLAGVERAAGVHFSLADALFESQSGFSTTGATVFAELENPQQLPRSILFWRCTTHYLGGLGIMVLFVVILGQGMAGKAFMKLEMSGKGTGGSGTRAVSNREMAKLVSLVYFGITLFGIATLLLLGLSFYDATCHSFSAVSTGGFSTFNASVGHFAANRSTFPHAAAIEWSLIAMMFISSCNFFLLSQLFLLRNKALSLLKSEEFLTYASVIIFATLLILVTGLAANDFNDFGTSDKTHLPTTQTIPTLEHSLRLACFQVVSLVSTTGFCTDEFEHWNAISLGTIFLLMVMGGCTGSTAGGWKTARFVILAKLYGQEIERSYRPNVVRPLRLDGEKVDAHILYNVLIFFAFAVLVFVMATCALLLIEPAASWGGEIANEAKLVDTVGMVIATFNNVGPGFGIVGARQNYGSLTEISKYILTLLMLFGRLEIMAVLALFHPTFWRH